MLKIVFAVVVNFNLKSNTNWIVCSISNQIVGVLIWNIDDYSKVNSTQIKYLAQLKFTLANYPNEPGLFSTSLNILQNPKRPIAVSASNQIFDHSIRRCTIFGILHILLVQVIFFWGN